MSRRRLLLLALPVALIALTSIGTWLAWRAWRTIPDFYQRALAAPAEEQAQASDQCVARIAALAGDARRSGTWEATFTAEEINGWLAVDMPKNYPQLAQGGVLAPRLAIGDQQATVAGRLADVDSATVFSISLSAYLVEPNVLAVRLRHARAGAVPLPLAKILEAISAAALEIDLPLEWRQADGDPVAIIRLDSPPNGRTQTSLEVVELRDGQLYLAGSTKKETDSPGQFSFDAENDPPHGENRP